jgi:hypothetical protein
MGPLLENINPKFRNLIDLLFFSNRMNLDLSEIKSLMKDNHNNHIDYLWDRFQKSSQIFWEDGQSFWQHRLSFIFDLNEKSLTKDVESYIEKRMHSLVHTKREPSVKHDVEFQQYLQYCKIKHSRKETLLPVKEYLLEISSTVRAAVLIKVVSVFIPFVFKDMNEYTDLVSKKITQSSRNFDLLRELEKEGVVFNKQPVFQLAKDLLLDRVLNDKNRRAFFRLLADPNILEKLKDIYKPAYKTRLLNLLEASEYQEIEGNHLNNVKNLLELDPTLGEELANIYADKLYQRRTGHKKANADKLIRLIRAFPQVQPKKVLAYLSSNNRMSDIKYILSAFPELKKLAAFV